MYSGIFNAVVTEFRQGFSQLRDELAGPPAWNYLIQPRHITGAHAALALCNVFPVSVKSIESCISEPFGSGGVVITFNCRLSDACKEMLGWYGKLSPSA